ncbi:MAG: hypothetical protein GF315_08925 [candidate division Zixibacteria bacterium]|nr:hypothetical protein [candidate division Zixibacteria bacterium]
MHLLPLCHERYIGWTPGKKLKGVVYYGPDKQVEIAPNAIDRTLIDNVNFFLNILTSADPPEALPPMSTLRF